MTVNLALPYNPINSPPRSKQEVIFYAPEQPDFIFTRGPEVTIWVQPINRPIALDWSLCRNMVATPFLTGSCLPGVDESFKMSIPTAHLRPGFYDLHVKIHQTAELSIDAITVFGWKPMEEPLVHIVPKDFKAFWDKQMAIIEKTPLDLKITPWKTLKGAEIGQYNIASAALPEDYDPAGEKYQEVEIYKVDFAAANGKRVYGWFAKPPGPGPFPAMLVLPGAGNNPRPAPVEHARHGYAALDVNVHNSQVDLPNKSDYPSPPYGAPFTAPENYWAFDVYCNALQAVNAIAKLPGVDPNRIVVMGGSQGGRATVIVAALHPKVKAAIAAIAHFGNVPWNNWTAHLNKTNDSGNREFTRAEVPDDAQTRVESYFDIMNFSPYIHCRFLMNSGLDDPVSPPTAVFGVYRGVPSAHKQLVPLPNMSHDFSPGFDTYAWRWLDKQLAQSPASK